MTSTQMGGGGFSQKWTHVDRGGGGVKAIMTSTVKYFYWYYCILQGSEVADLGCSGRSRVHLSQ